MYYSIFLNDWEIASMIVNNAYVLTTRIVLRRETLDWSIPDKLELRT